MRRTVLLASALAVAAWSGAANAGSIAFCGGWVPNVTAVRGQAAVTKCAPALEVLSNRDTLDWCMKNSDAEAQQVQQAAVAALSQCAAAANAPAAEPAGDAGGNAGADNEGAGDAGGGDAGGGNTQTVTEDTDLYDAREGNKIGGEGDFLHKGDKVTVVGECGDDWCELSNPKGWVWGGHLK